MVSLRKQILRESVTYIADEPKLIRLATITTFVHSLLFLAYIIYAIFSINERATGQSNAMTDLMGEFVDLLSINSTTVVFFVIAVIIMLIGYVVLPPLGDAAMIYYIDAQQGGKKAGGTASLGKGFKKFVPMREFNATLGFLNLVSRSLAVSRVYVMDILNPIMITVLAVWFIFIMTIMIFLPYTRYVIALEDKGYLEAMRESAGLALGHFGTTMKFVVINIFLYIRFVVNVIIVLGIPFGLIRVARWFDLVDNTLFQSIIVIMIRVLFLLTAYINGIIEAFFNTYRWKVYKKIKADEEA